MKIVKLSPSAILVNKRKIMSLPVSLKREDVKRKNFNEITAEIVVQLSLQSSRKIHYLPATIIPTHLLDLFSEAYDSILAP